ncbi:uncharacterized protein LOC121268004 [Juglans microcarpa x Juglans regia]|uniref:uncharacterized protein LOC121268004 n=1 Tax=Juglans microcarpa x Juglans regia TaxID=2249226 RepID=UPI001B7EA4E2|nr:uncharacterized protein LOC121268004 [Juglans microcarpa x Juglans regia]
MAKHQKALEFASLTQGNMTVDQYAARFMEMGRFAPHLISTKKMQAQADRKKGFPYSSRSSTGKRKALVTPSKGKGVVVGKAAPITPPPCRQCGKRHSGNCRRASRACFRCGQIGNMIRDCQQITPGGVSTPNAKPKTAAKAKVYAITPRGVDLEADETADARVIIGNISNLALIIDSLCLGILSNHSYLFR